MLSMFFSLSLSLLLIFNLVSKILWKETLNLSFGCNDSPLPPHPVEFQSLKI